MTTCVPFRKVWVVAVLMLSIAGTARSEVILQFFNASWNEITEKMPEIAEVGYESLWLPPPQKASGDLSVGYDLWDPFDLGNNPQRTGGRTRYGTEDDLHRLIQTAHRHGLRVYFDNIMNHRAFDIPGYDENTPIDIYPGMYPEDFHLQVTEDGFYRAWPDTVNWGSSWEVQNYWLSGLIDIAHENPNSNFGPNAGDTHPVIRAVRHPYNPEYYDYHPTLGWVGFGSTNITTNVIAQNEAFFEEDLGGYLMRSVRWLMDRTKADGLRLDAVKHVPAYFFGEQYAANKDESSSGYNGQAQLQYNITHGYSDANHRDTLFDTQAPRDDAMIFGEHMGEPPDYQEYFDSGMRLIDAKIHQTLNDRLGNGYATLQGLDYAGYVEGFQFGEALGMAYAKSHDDAIAYNENLHYAINLTRPGLPNIYTDGNRQAETLGDSGGAFPRHANTTYLGQWGDRTIPNLVYIHNHFARGYQYGRWADNNILAYERMDKRENGAMTDGDGVTLFMVINDNYDSNESRSIDTAFPEGSMLWQYAETGYNFYETVTGGKLNVNVPPGKYFAFSWRSPEESLLWKNAGGKALTIYENGEETGWISYERKDGPDGDPGFNPYGVTDSDATDFKYEYYVPRVTSATSLSFVARVDGSANNVMFKLNGGVDLNGATHALGDPRDNPPALATDNFLGYEEASFVQRMHGEKFAAVDTLRNTIGSAGAETYEVTIGQDGYTVYNGSGSNDYSSAETASFVYHDPSGQDDLFNSQFWPPPTNAAGQDLWLEVKIGKQFDINKVYVYYTTDGASFPEGAGGYGIGNTKVVELGFHHNEVNGSQTNDWWGNNPIPGLPGGTVVRYKIGCYRQQDGGANSPWVVPFPNSQANIDVKTSMMGQWEIDNFNPSTLVYRPHNDYGLYATGLVEGFHMIRARAFLQRDGAAEGNGKRAAIYNTFQQSFYYDTESPQGEVVWPKENDTLGQNRYGCVVRTDPTVTKVWYYIADANDANDDGQTGQEFGNGTNAAGDIAWIEAVQVSPEPSIESDYLTEWRFDYNNIASSNTAATIYVKLAEISSSTNPLDSDAVGHFTTLERNVIADGPDYTMFVAWPQNDGDTVGVPYDMKVYFSQALWDVDETTTRNRFIVTLDGEVQGREDYDLTFLGAGGWHELSFSLPDMYNGDPEYIHEIEVIHTNAASGSVTLFADRKVKSWPTADKVAVKVLDPPQYDLDGAPYLIVLPDVASPTPEQRSYNIRVETDKAAKDVWISFTNSIGYANPVPATTNLLTGTVTVNNGSQALTGQGSSFSSEATAGTVLRIGTNLVVVSSVSSDSNLLLNAEYAGASVTNASAYRIVGNPAEVADKYYWTFNWTNLSQGQYTMVANVDTNYDTGTVEAFAERTTHVILRESVTNNPADLDDDDDGLYDTMENTATNLPTSNPETWNNGDVHIWLIYGKTDPLRPDSDGDGLPDGLESGWRGPIDPAQTDTNMDTNGDGWPNFAGDYDPPFFNTVPDNYDVPDYNFNGSRTEMIAGSMTDPNNPDSDYDGIPDGIEDADHNGWVNGDGDALAPGQDKSTRVNWPDGEMQGWETWTETDPNNWDTDGDGASDGYQEDWDYNGSISGDTNNNRTWDAGEEWRETDPLNPDTDGDGLPDGWEMQYGFSPYDNGVPGSTNMWTGGIIGDDLNGAAGNPDGDFIVVGITTNPYNNLLEYQNGTNPWQPDNGEEPPEGAITIGRGPAIGVINGVTNYQEFADWTWEDCIVLDEYDGIGINEDGADVYPGWTSDAEGNVYNDGFDSSRDIVAFYARDGGNEDGKFYFRIDFQDLQAFAEDNFLNIYIVIDTGVPSQGEVNLPDDVDTITDMKWEAVVAIYGGSQGAVYVDTQNANNTTTWGQSLDGSVGVERRDQATANGFIDAYFNSEMDAVEVAISRQALLDASWNGLNPDTLNYQVFTTKDGTSNSEPPNGWPGAGDIGGRSDVRDTIYDDRLAEDRGDAQAGIEARLYSWFSGGTKAGNAKVSMIVHGNQAIQPGSVVQKLINDGAGAGYHRVLDIHDIFDLPFNLHVTPTLASALEWAVADPATNMPWLDGPSLNDRISDMIQTNLIDLMASTFADHMMPYFTTDFNVDNEALSRSLLEHIYGTTFTSNTVFWTPERLLDHDVFTKIGAMGYRSTVLDQWEHILRWYGRSDALGDRGYQMNRISGITTFAVNNIAADFRFSNYDGGLNMALRRLFIRKARDNQDQVITLLSNWEDFGVKSQADAYDVNLRWIANHPWIKVVTLEDILSGEVDINQDGIGDDFWYVQERGDLSGQNKLAHNYVNFASQLDYDNWYNGSSQEEGLVGKVFDIRPGVPLPDAYGMLYSGGIVSDTWASVSSLTNAYVEALGKGALFASVFETAFHDQGVVDMSKYSTGDYISPDTTSNSLAGFSKIAQAQGRFAARYAELGNWLASAPSMTNVLTWAADYDLDGEDEYILFNSHVLAMFERIGGRMVAAWVRDPLRNVPFQVIGNPFSYAGTETEEEGDSNFDGGNIKAFRTSALKDWWAGTSAYVNDMYTFVNIGNGWQITSSDGAIQKTVTLAPGSSQFEVDYQLSGALAGQTLYTRHGLSPNLMDLLMNGQANLGAETDSGGVVSLENDNGDTLVSAAVEYSAGGYTASFNGTAVDDDPGTTNDFATLRMRNQAQTHQVEIFGTGSFDFAIDLGADMSTFDGDADNLSDAWENHYFGNTAAANMSTDNDGDGAFDIQEFISGTVPTDANDLLSVVDQVISGSGITLSFPTKIDHRYYIYYKQEAGGTSWTLANSNSPISGTGSTAVWMDDGTQTAPPPFSTTSRVYSIEVQMQ